MESLLEYQRWMKTAVDYSKVPNQKMVAGIKRYVEHGISPGSFVTNLLCNNLRGTLNCADPANSALISEWLDWAHDIPSPLLGSKEAMVEHCKKMATRTE